MDAKVTTTTYISQFTNISVQITKAKTCSEFIDDTGIYDHRHGDKGATGFKTMSEKIITAVPTTWSISAFGE